VVRSEEKKPLGSKHGQTPRGFFMPQELESSALPLDLDLLNL